MPARKRSFSLWIPRYLNHLKMRNYSVKTIDTYGRVLLDFSTYCAEVQGLGDPAVDTDGYDITQFLAESSGTRSLSATTMNRYISTLNSFYRFLVGQQVLPANPVLGVDRPKIKGRELLYLKHADVVSLLDAIENTRDRLIIRTIYATGVRVSELCGISVKDIDFQEQTIRIQGKGDKIRTVFIDEETLSEIRSYLGSRKNGPLFTGHNGSPLSPRTIQHIFRKYAPSGITPHKIRHSYASELYRRSRNLRVVQENLGHSSIKTTEVYLHTDLEERRRVYQDHFPLSGNHESGNAR
ncbi:MAG: integrase [Methanocalculus sp. MSAO_Arc1]|uniref:site-specific tyrosine recombinase/integron integrase n=1 Tax=Methanocalculus TaxID=71151 RepID=UPI000FEEF76C|nr:MULTISPECIES: site-specific tyrosine recombinase/integron integrase [unclassified Methanocalculus]MCP1662857.1 site-specific recombinase XerD [Methanocalculus sp. AMF5]RQD78981.1 MAG: integrase [Methanocalculus sp. MSAO_Arc1]